MFWDVVIVAGVGFTQLVLTWYGIHISVRERRVRNAVIIGFVGAIGIALTVWGAIRTGISQQKLESDIATLEQGQQAANAGIQEIKHNPPIVNVPPAIVKVPQSGPRGASVTLENRVESSYPELDANGKPTGRGIAFVVGKPLSFNFFGINTGPETADDVKGTGKIYLQKTLPGPRQEEEAEEEATKRFKAFLKKPNAAVIASPMAPGPSGERWGTAESDAQITSDDIEQLKNGKELIFLYVYHTWRDSAGQHYFQYCRWVQPPAFSPEVWHVCTDFHEHR